MINIVGRSSLYCFSAIDFLHPVDDYRGDPERLREECSRKIAQIRRRRKEWNLLIE